MATHISEALVYAPLPQHVLQHGEELGLMSSMRSHFLTSFLQNHVSSQLIQEGLEDTLRHQQKSLSLSNNIVNRKDAKKRAKPVKRLNAQQRKKLKLVDIKQEEQRFELYLPLHSLWKDYMSDLVNLEKLSAKNMPEFETKLLKADFHGALLTVTKSKCPSLIGLTGLVLLETKNTFKLITTKNQLKTIPKQNTVFSLAVGDFLLTIYGNNFLFKAAERSIRSFKTKPTIDL